MSPPWMAVSVSNDMAQLNNVSLPSNKGRQSLDLTVGISFSTPYIMVDDLAAGNYIHYFQTTVYASRHTGADNAIGVKVAD